MPKGVMAVNQQKSGRWMITHQWHLGNGSRRCLLTEKLAPGEEPMFENAEEFVEWYFDVYKEGVGVRRNYEIMVIGYESEQNKVFKFGDKEYITITDDRTDETMTMPIKFYDKYYKEVLDNEKLD